MLRIVWSGLLLAGCAGAVSEDAGEDGALPVRWQEAQNARRFACAPFPPDTRVRISMTVKTAFRLVDAHGAEQIRDIGMESATYRIEPLPASNVRRLRVVLEDMKFETLDPKAAPKSAWATGVERGWTGVGASFDIERSRDGWCWSGASGCDESDPERTKFAAAVGANVDLLELTAEIAPSLDGMENDGSLTVSLPQKVSRRLGVQEGLIAQATRPGYPASFIVTRSSSIPVPRTSKAQDGTVTQEPQNLYQEAEAALVVDANCRVLELRRVQRLRLPFFEGKLPSSAGIVSTLSWQFTPIGE